MLSEKLSSRSIVSGIESKLYIRRLRNKQRACSLVVKFRSPTRQPPGDFNKNNFMFTVYVLQSSKDKLFYVGFTSNLERRLHEHTEGRVKSTRHRRPMKLVYKENYSTKQLAQNRERYFKGGGQARKILKELINM